MYCAPFRACLLVHILGTCNFFYSDQDDDMELLKKIKTELLSVGKPGWCKLKPGYSRKGKGSCKLQLAGRGWNWNGNCWKR